MNDINYEIGISGEYLVCSEITARGLPAFMAFGRARYDVVTEIKKKLIRVQVKTCIEPKQHKANLGCGLYYKTNVRCYGAKGRTPYSSSDADLLAIVALDQKLIAWLPFSATQSYRLRSKKFADSYTKHRNALFLEDLTFDLAVKELFDGK